MENSLVPADIATGLREIAGRLESYVERLRILASGVERGSLPSSKNAEAAGLMRSIDSDLRDANLGIEGVKVKGEALAALLQQ